MNKYLLTVITLILLIFTGCSQSVMYSKKYEGIPIYPGIKLKDSSKYTEYYRLQDFNGTLAEVNKFYLEHIDKDIWSIETSIPYNQENSHIGALQTQKYILKDNEREVSLIIQRTITSEDGSGPLDVIVNGAPFKEAKYKVQGESNHWKALTEYVFTKERVKIDGSAQYIGTNSPKNVEYEFMYYIIGSPVQEESVSKKGNLNGSKINLNGWDDRKYELEIYKEAIKNAYIKIKWEEQGENLIEKIDLDIIEEHTV